MFELLHAGFDTLDIAVAGALPLETLTLLEGAREAALMRQEPALVTVGPGEVAMHVSAHGMQGGYAFVADTGPNGAKWMFKNNPDPRQWNVFVSPRATMLLALGYRDTREALLKTLQAMGVLVTDHSINRVDFAMDFRAPEFELRVEQFVAHSHTKVSPYWGKKTHTADSNQPTAVLRGRRLESVTIGKQPGRQIIVYDKRREAIAKQKFYWFDAWGLSRSDTDSQVWRVEVRAGKKELKDKYQIRRFEDFEAAIGDVIVNALEDVRYLGDHQRDSNVTRQNLHPIWQAAKAVAQRNLIELRSGLTRNQILEIERELAIERYAQLTLGNAIGLGIAKGLSDGEMAKDLPGLIAKYIEAAAHSNEERLSRSLQRARAKLYFIGDQNT